MWPIWTCALAAAKANSLKAVDMAKALQDFHLPPEIALGPNPAFYRAGQNQLLATLFVGNAQASGSAPDDLFKVTNVVNGAEVAELAGGERLQDDLADLTIMRGERGGSLAPPQAARAASRRMTQVVLFNVFNGLIVGAFYALMALGLSLILNLSGVINFAHGGFLALGAYLAYTLIPYIGFWGALILAPPLTAVLGLVVERLLIRPLYGQDPLYGLLLTFGLAYIFEDMMRVIWGAQSVPFQVPAWLMTSLSSQYFFLTGYRVFMMIIVAAAVGGLFAVLKYTRLGMRIRAGTRDLDTVSTLGVNVRMLRSLNFGIGIYMAGLAGVLAAGLLGLSPTIGANLIMPSFVAIIVGGLGSLLGTLLGGLLIGVASGLAAVYFPSATEAVIYVMMGLVLLVRPRGLLGEEGRLH